MSTSTPTSTPQEMAEQLRKVFLANLAKRAKAGDRLSEPEWTRLEELAAPPPEPTPATPYAELTASIAELRAAGKPVPKHLAQAAREAWLTEQAELLWPTIGAAAGELGVSVQTVRNWQAEGAPIKVRTAISKAAVYRWLWQRAEDRLSAAAAKATSNPLDDAIKQARLDEKTGRLIAEADDRARQAVIRLAGELRHELIGTLPGRALDEIATLDRSSAEAHLRQMLLAVLDHHRTHTEPTDAP